MTRRTTALMATAVMATAFAAPNAEAKYLVVFQEIGGNVDEFGQGSLDLTDLTPAIGPGPASQINVIPNQAIFESGDPDKPLVLFTGVTGPDTFGPGNGDATDDGSGDPIGIAAMPGLKAVLVSPSYVSGASLVEGSSYAGATFASLGMTPGTYVWSWGAGDHADTFTIEIGSELALGSVPEPSTWAMMLIGLAGLGYAAARRKNAALDDA